MILLLQRIFHNEQRTIGKLLIDGVEECWTLEDTKRLEKINGITRIPAGSYKTRVRTWGRIHEKYTNRFNFHEGTIELMNVPNFTDILIHIGNNPEDTEGCILVGKWLTIQMDLAYSTMAYTSLYKKIIAAAKIGMLAVIIKDEP